MNVEEVETYLMSVEHQSDNQQQIQSLTGLSAQEINEEVDLFFAINNDDRPIVIEQLPSQLANSEVANIISDACQSEKMSAAEIDDFSNAIPEIGEFIQRHCCAFD